MRFLPPVAALADGPVAFDGDPHARKRPNDGVIWALRDLGVKVDDGGRAALPFTVKAKGGVTGGDLEVDASKTSQLISALLMAAPRFKRGLDLRHVGDRPVPSRPYLDMVVQMLRQAGAEVDDSEENRWRVEPGTLRGREWVIEPDLQNAAPFLCAAVAVGGRVTVLDWPTETTQAGDRIRDVLVEMGSRVEWTRGGLTVVGAPALLPVHLDLADASELTPRWRPCSASTAVPPRSTGSPTSGATRPTASPPWPRSSPSSAPTSSNTTTASRSAGTPPAR
ncbi:hypothetical protein GCM10029992_60910 [Glycomyces albus]